MEVEVGRLIMVVGTLNAGMVKVGSRYVGVEVGDRLLEVGGRSAELVEVEAQMYNGGRKLESDCSR